MFICFGSFLYVWRIKSTKQCRMFVARSYFHRCTLSLKEPFKIYYVLFYKLKPKKMCFIFLIYIFVFNGNFWMLCYCFPFLWGQTTKTVMSDCELIMKKTETLLKLKKKYAFLFSSLIYVNAVLCGLKWRLTKILLIKRFFICVVALVCLCVFFFFFVCCFLIANSTKVYAKKLL